MQISRLSVVEAAVAQAACDLYVTCSDAARARATAKLVEETGDAVLEADILRRKARRLLLDEV